MKKMPVVLIVVVETEKLVATDVVVVENDVVVDDDVVVVLYVVIVVARVTPRKLEAKSSPVPVGHGAPGVGATEQAWIVIR